MNVLKITAAATIAAVLLIACAAEEDPEGVIPEGHRKALEKAEGVEGQLEDALQQRDQGIEEN